MSEIVQTPAWQRLPLGPKYSSWHTTIKIVEVFNLVQRKAVPVEHWKKSLLLAAVTKAAKNPAAVPYAAAESCSSRL